MAVRRASTVAKEKSGGAAERSMSTLDVESLPAPNTGIPKKYNVFHKVWYWHKTQWRGANLYECLLLVVVALALWWVVPSGLPAQTWHVFVLFLVTILGAIMEPLPMSGVCLVMLAVIALTQTLTTAEMLSGFGNDTVWLIVFAFFISSGFVSTGLGKRICFYVLKLVGSTTLGLAYGFCLCEFILAIAIPSSTARAAGIMLPILQPLLEEGFSSSPRQGTEKLIGKYLIMVEFTANATSSISWLTGGAWNALMAQFMRDVGVDVGWVEWAYSMAPVGIFPLAIAPLVIFLVFPPEIKKTPEAKSIAENKLKEMGAMTMGEIQMMIVFGIVILLWILSSMVKTIFPFSTTAVASIGVACLLLLGIINVKDDIVSNQGAFDLLIWFGVLLMLASELKEKGFFDWFASLIDLSGMSAVPVTILITFIFYATQYAFASITAHVSALFPVFLSIMQQSHVPMEMGCRALAYTTLSGHLTPYTSSSNPPLFALGYVKTGEWWLLGVILFVVNMCLLMSVGFGYWWILGYWKS
ncbi:conserved hypothetical protein [Perkinsus marinus ATCC 50983]|uniref:Sodium/sulfate symporter n=1 Tax=Perkinsus marinus (strain ATCC 50983 / TXsc) TaxID=423536 RepID=C5KR59_PERM5|nr:conserved hypothetical protein [Perkinsus marinus ATCC 50983]EER13033.1 conserved hypothetical protein [Perkinsus marinus ATCC 50983]|eukprot:XP_002781238.1 conserved hypothetical protein [Perkinsus marinus ATCC 50983]